MPSQVAGNLVIDYYRVLDQNDAPLTGMLVPADVTLSLYRQSGGVLIAASEVVSWTEIGATGSYFFTFTPQFTGLYLLYLVEVDALTGLRQRDFRYDILAAGAVFAPSYANAFCAETDVERYLLQQIDSTTKPNDTQVAGWAQGRADVLESLCAGLGSTVTPLTVAAGSRLEGLLREANAIGAALDCTVAQTFKTGEVQTTKILSLISAWEAYCGKYINGELVGGYILIEISQNTVSLATNHTLSGDTIARDNSNPPHDVGAQVGMDDVY